MDGRKYTSSARQVGVNAVKRHSYTDGCSHHAWQRSNNSWTKFNLDEEFDLVVPVASVGVPFEMTELDTEKIWIEPVARCTYK